ncbi:3-hydroxyacyl-ACP dehydratase FabZ [Bacillus atrophaeus]|uniref:(3R)-hydroxymyristoyl-ACP dehydratase n=1 Tax=Bacillus atrophaeus (strain 1942) TaxID=720555 RepID=A0ABM5LTM0_BACA1|nr:3-hydroxyacyl-ACP dehydratase FabZ [Bacillus atrophaeus]AMR63851.1 beta-hydroxyacyl-ACP dehydratase [Bacillus subtilis subsp. globigii]ADP31144.1 (3R)-hydroxymyristoyl-ACP dehydratase [Bacillus atrophaeus 1942]AIK47789.1 fabA-like domain protein [Bacillus atrophaeus subsp. globigii]EIM09340.1 (3R)-hydroxymyristoyl-ACP dehydratase [Bacillus atrophaeus C89]KFK81158.1 fabA-like domain protein [Bacillus atrophaeus]
MNLLSHDDVLEILPQRYPFVMVDRVIEIGETKITTIKNVTGNEPCFQGHFPNKKIFPGVYITEAIAQTAILLFSKIDHSIETDKTLPLLYHTNVKFKKPIIPGDQMVITLNIIKKISNAAIVKAEVKVDDVRCSFGELTFTLVGDE